MGEVESLLAQVRRAVSSSGAGPESWEPELHHLAARLLLLARRGGEVTVTERDEAAVSGDLVDITYIVCRYCLDDLHSHVPVSRSFALEAGDSQW